MLSDKTLRITMDDALKPFFLHYLRSRQGRLEIEKRSTGNQESMRNIGQERIRSIIVPECSLPEQQEIVRLLDAQFEAIERNERELDAALKRSEALRQSILKRAFSGRLVPPACRQAGKTPAEFPQPQPGKWWVYVLLCDDGSFHKGFTDNLPELWQRHLSGHGAQWTAQHPPVELYYWEECWSEASAVARERYLKTEIGREWFQKEVVAKPHEYEPASALLARLRAERAASSGTRRTHRVP
jgi:predicted GIY-YIG superfamily endonuclease